MEINSLLGPQVALIDDKEEEIASIETLLNELNIGNKFFKVDYIDPKYPTEPISTIELVFLDLYYNPNFGAAFDPYSCVEWIKHIVPQDKKYILIVWTKDIYVKDELLEVIEEMKVTPPYIIDVKQKTDYQKSQNIYDIKKLLDELNIILESNTEDVVEFYGQIISIEERSVLINCLLDESTQTFEVRRFDKTPFEDYINLSKGIFLKIKITTQPGIRTFEFVKELNDLSIKFKKSEYYEDLGSLDFLNDK